MKGFRNVILILGFLGLVAFSQAKVSFAHEGEHGKGDLQMLRDAAAALKASNADLSERLSKYADHEEMEAKEDEGEEHEKM